MRLISAYAADTRPDLDQLALELERDPTLALGIRNIDASEFLGAVFARSLDALPAPAHGLTLALGLVRQPRLAASPPSHWEQGSA